MAPESPWRVRSREVIQATLAALPADATLADKRRALRDAYPFGERQYTPYRMWCEEVRKALAVVSSGYPGHPYSWTFRVYFQGLMIQFGGIPNQCATKRQAAARAGWWLRWLRTGEYDRKYRAMGGNGKGGRRG